MSEIKDRLKSQVYYGTASYFANNANFQPIMNNHYEIHIKGLTNDILNMIDRGEIFTGDVEYREALEKAQEVISVGDLGEVLRLTVQEFKTAEINVNSIDIRHGNDRVKLAGQVSVGDCSITVHDVIGADTQLALWGWFNLVYSPTKKVMGINVDYKKDATIYQFAPDGSTVRSWDCYGLWPDSMPANSFSYDSSKNIDITVKLNCDNILLKRDNKEPENDLYYRNGSISQPYELVNNQETGD